MEELEDARHDALADRQRAAESEQISHKLVNELHARLRYRNQQIAELRAEQEAGPAVEFLGALTVTRMLHRFGTERKAVAT